MREQRRGLRPEENAGTLVWGFFFSSNFYFLFESVLNLTRVCPECGTHFGLTLVHTQAYLWSTQACLWSTED